MEVLEGRAESEPPQAPQGSRLSRLTGKKKKKARRGQIPAGIQQHPDASSSVDTPEIPSAMEVEVEELLPLPEVGLKFSKGAGYTFSALECVPSSQALSTGAGGVSQLGDLGEDCTVCTHVLLCILHTGKEEGDNSEMNQRGSSPRSEEMGQQGAEGCRTPAANLLGLRCMSFCGHCDQA